MKPITNIFYRRLSSFCTTVFEKVSTVFGRVIAACKGVKNIYIFSNNKSAVSDKKFIARNIKPDNEKSQSASAVKTSPVVKEKYNLSPEKVQTCFCAELNAVQKFKEELTDERSHKNTANFFDFMMHSNQFHKQIDFMNDSLTFFSGAEEFYKKIGSISNAASNLKDHLQSSFGGNALSLCNNLQSIIDICKEIINAKFVDGEKMEQPSLGTLTTGIKDQSTDEVNRYRRLLSYLKNAKESSQKQQDEWYEGLDPDARYAVRFIQEFVILYGNYADQIPINNMKVSAMSVSDFESFSYSASSLKSFIYKEGMDCLDLPEATCKQLEDSLGRLIHYAETLSIKAFLKKGKLDTQDFSGDTEN